MTIVIGMSDFQYWSLQHAFPGGCGMDLNTQRFGVRWSALPWLTTIAVLAVSAVVVVVVWWAAVDAVLRGLGLPQWAFVVTCVVLGPSVAAALFAPLGYEVRPHAVVIRRLARNRVIPLGMIRELRQVRLEEIGFGLQVGACCGFLGWFGPFYNPRLGSFWAYVGNQKDWVLLTLTDGTKIVVSPCRPKAFLKAARELMQAAN
jgi:hypothetical protein